MALWANPDDLADRSRVLPDAILYYWPDANGTASDTVGGEQPGQTR
jgi:hypothetical protein